MRTMHLSDLVVIAAGLLTFLALLTMPDWWPLLRAMGWRFIDHFFVVRWGGEILSSPAAPATAESATEDAGKGEVSPVKRNGETAGNAIATGKTEGNDPFQFPDLFTGLAKLIHAQELTETKALKLACGVSPGKSARYLAARDQLHAALAQLAPGPTFNQLDEAHRTAGVVPTKSE